MPTFYEKSPLKLAQGDNVTFYDNGKDGYPKKTVNGIVTGVADEGFEVQWEDLEFPTDYEWSKVTIKGDQIFER